jgi:hypothetical protein
LRAASFLTASPVSTGRQFEVPADADFLFEVFGPQWRRSDRRYPQLSGVTGRIYNDLSVTTLRP